MNMKKIAVVLMLAISASTLLADAMARPMGGGRSIGRQSSNVARQAPAPAPAPVRPATPAPAATPTPAPAMQPKPASPWKGILGGALLGLGLGALLSHFGMGAAMASMFGSLIMIGLLVLVVWFVYRLFRSKTGAGNTAFQGNFGGGNAAGGGFSDSAPLPQGASGTPEIGSRLQPQSQPQPQPFQHLQPQASPSGVSLDKPAATAPWGVPADFDSAAFLRHAKTNFIRLQAAWDKADVNDIREFTTPEVYAELKMQIQERGGNADFTDVVSIDAELMGIETGDKDYLASVKFTGQIRSAPGALAEPFAEVWNLAKPLAGDGGWLLAGIQQLA